MRSKGRFEDVKESVKYFGFGVEIKKKNGVYRDSQQKMQWME